MEIELDGEISQPIWPKGIEVRGIRRGEERELYEVQRETFRDTWEPLEESFEDWSHALLRGPRYVPSLWFVAEEGSEIVGFAICYPYPTAPDLGFVGFLGVRRPSRKKGLGRALLLHAFTAFKERGLTRAGLGVDSESPTGANTLYQQVGMRPTRRWELYEKSLRKVHRHSDPRAANS